VVWLPVAGGYDMLELKELAARIPALVMTTSLALTGHP
jgi:hypothetical protein